MHVCQLPTSPVGLDTVSEGGASERAGGGGIDGGGAEGGKDGSGEDGNGGGTEDGAGNGKSTEGGRDKRDDGGGGGIGTELSSWGRNPGVPNAPCRPLVPPFLAGTSSLDPASMHAAAPSPQRAPVAASLQLEGPCPVRSPSARGSRCGTTLLNGLLV